MSKDYRLIVLRMAVEGSLPREIDAKGKYAHLLATCVELEESGYLKGGSMRGGQGQPILFTFLNITPKGRDCLSELQERLPVSRFKAKMEDLLWVIITAAITAAITSVVTTVTMKALTKP